jgi:hypothetical protein
VKDGKGQAAQQRRGAKDCGEYRQATGSCKVNFGDSHHMVKSRLVGLA